MRNKRAGKAVAALAMGIVVAAGAKESGPSLTYHELLVLAGDKTQAASAKQDLEAASGLPEAIGEEAVAVSKLKEELEEIDAENSASSEAVPEEMPESEAAASEESASAESTAPEVSSASEASASSVPSSAAESHAVSEAASVPSSTAASSAPTAEELCDQQVAEYIRQIEQLQARSEKRLYSIMLSAYSEYMSHPVEERNLVTKVSAVLSKSGELTAAQNQCDAEFAQIMDILSRYTYHRSFRTLTGAHQIDGNHAGFWLHVYLDHGNDRVDFACGGTGEILIDSAWRVGYWGDRASLSMMAEL